MATGLGLVTQKIAMRTLHIRAKSFGVPLLAALSAMVVWTSVITMRTVAKVSARVAHRNIAANECFLSIIVVIVVAMIINIAIGIVVISAHVVVRLTVISSVELIAFVIALSACLSPSVAMGASYGHSRAHAHHGPFVAGAWGPYMIAGCPTVLHLLHT